MFGHQDDIITQDQKRDANVTIPESALDALTGAPASGSTTDSPVVTPSPQDDSSASQPIPSSAPSAPGLAPTSIDGFTAPNEKLSSPFSYMQNNSSDDSDDTTAASSTPTEDTQEQAEVGQLPEDSLLHSPAQDHDENQAAAEYLDNLVAENPHVPEQQDETSNEEPAEEEINETNTEEPAEEEIIEPTEEVIEEPIEQPLPEPPANNEHLLAIKQDALGQLSPLVGQLNLEPEEKFHTIMMLIRASDNETLLGDAYAAAKSIPDEKLRAQALLDVVNEINYFTGNESVAA